MLKLALLFWEVAGRSIAFFAGYNKNIDIAGEDHAFFNKAQYKIHPSQPQ